MASPRQIVSNSPAIDLVESMKIIRLTKGESKMNQRSSALKLAINMMDLTTPR
ncbi:MAG: hypothetical protein IPP34_07760 [Bacteroidetes bacterium]|nr:hypothetical protein [Bacteroidota bacterium]